MPPLDRRALLVLIGTLVAACHHEMPAPEPVPEQGLRSGEPVGFAVRRDQPQLLPFWVRHQRLAHILDVATDDPVFATLLDNRLLLGDSDHAGGVAVDLQWNPAKMALWTRSLRPICAHPNLAARHPSLPQDLMRSAWGREPTPDEISGLARELDEAGVPDSARPEVTCLAVLSSLEMVAQ